MNGDPLADVLATSQQPQAPSGPKKDPLAKVFSGPKKDPLAKVFLPESTRALVAPPEEPGLLRQIGSFIVDQVVEQVKDASAALGYVIQGPSTGLPVGAGDIATQLAAERRAPQVPIPPEEHARILRGAALIASYGAAEAAAPLLASIPAAGRVGTALARPLFARATPQLSLFRGSLLGKWGSFLTAEFLGGGAYGAIRPTDEGESRIAAILGDAAQFAFVGGGFKFGWTHASAAFKRYILGMEPRKRAVSLVTFKDGQNRINQALAEGGVNLDMLPPDAGAQLELPLLEEAIRAAEPGADVAEIIRNEANRTIEAQPAPAEGAVSKPLFKLWQEAVGAVPAPTKSLPEPEYITNVALKSKAGKVYVGEGESTHPEMIVNLVSKGRAKLDEFIDPATEEYAKHDVPGFVTNKRAFVSKDEAMAKKIRGRKYTEKLIAPTVKDKAGKLHVGGATHPETIQQAVQTGTPAEALDVPDANRGFKTNQRDFVSREEAAKLAGEADPLHSETMHQKGLTPLESPADAEAAMHQTVSEAAEAPQLPSVVPPGEKIAAPAVMAADGRYFAGTSHLDATQRAQAAGAQVPETFAHGFITDKGTFLPYLEGGLGQLTSEEVSPALGPKLASQAAEVEKLANKRGRGALPADVGKALEKGTAALEMIPPLPRPVIEAALMDAATTHAVASTPMEKLASPSVKAAVKRVRDARGRFVKRIPAKIVGGKEAVGAKLLEDVYDPARLTREGSAVKIASAGDVLRPDHIQAFRDAGLDLPIRTDRGFLRVSTRGVSADELAGLMTARFSSTGVQLGKMSAEEAVKRAAELTEEAKARSRAAFAEALARESPAAEQQVVEALTSPTPAEVEATAQGAPFFEQKEIQAELERRSAAEKAEEAPIHVDPLEQIHAPSTPSDATLTTPKAMNGMQLLEHVREKHAKTVEDALKKIAQSQAGIAAPRVLMMLTGGGMIYSSTGENVSPGDAAALRTIGGLLMWAGASRSMREWMAKSKFLRDVRIRANPAKFFSAREADVFRRYQESWTTDNTKKAIAKAEIERIWPDEASQRALAYVLDEGPAAPEWSLLTPHQQANALALQQIQARLEAQIYAVGKLDSYLDDRVRVMLPPESFQVWRRTGFKQVMTQQGLQRQRIVNIRELEQWAQANGVKGPRLDPVRTQPLHMQNADRTMGLLALHDELERQAIVVNPPQSGPMPPGYRYVNIPHFAGKMAPEATATALENLAKPQASSYEIVNALDTIKAIWMRTIMIWPWEHGLNVFRLLPAIMDNPQLAGEAWRAIKRMDPGMVEAASHGLNLHDRPDFGPRAYESWEYLLGKIKLGSMGARLDRLHEVGEHKLWDQWVPFAQYFIYRNEMVKWSERTKGVFLPHTAEYKAAARKAADYANTLGGKVPSLLRDPELSRMMRLAMFSPQWTSSRITMMAKAAGELGDFAEGRLNIKDATYLQFKMRQLAFGAVSTMLLSKLMSGFWPAFNPNSTKFYMRTGLHNSDGREIGVDLTGWWQGDVKLFNHPFNYMFDRLNPTLKVAYETLSGRDYRGRDMTTGQSIGNVIASLGAGLESVTGPVSMLARTAIGQTPTAGEVVQEASRALGTGNVAILPKPIDAMLSKVARKLLIRQGIPANADNIFDLTRIMRGNRESGRDLISDEVINWLTYHRRVEMRRSPISTALEKVAGLQKVEEFDAMWQEARRVLASF